MPSTVDRIPKTIATPIIFVFNFDPTIIDLLVLRKAKRQKMIGLLMLVSSSVGYPNPCTFCGTGANGKAHTFDVSTLSNATFTLPDSRSGTGK